MHFYLTPKSGHACHKANNINTEPVWLFVKQAHFKLLDLIIRKTGIFKVKIFLINYHLYLDPKKLPLSDFFDGQDLNEGFLLTID